MKNFIKTAIQENYHKHLVIGAIIGALIALILSITIAKELGFFSITLITTIISILPCMAWEWYFGRKNGAPFSVADIIAGVIGAFLGALILTLITIF